MAMKKVELDIDVLNEMILKFTKDRLAQTTSDYDERDGTIWITLPNGKAYSCHLQFEECPF